jgi:hypothetical protein
MSIRPGYTRVSEILAQNNSYAGINPSILHRKALIGTEVHSAIACYWEDIYLPLVNRSKRYFDSFLAWSSTISAKPLLWEKRFYCDDLMITGAIDALIQFQGSSVPSLVDFKTSASPSPNWRYQAMFYHYLASKNGCKLSDRIFFVQLHQTKAMADLYEYQATPSLWNECEQLVKTYREKFPLCVDGK